MKFEPFENHQLMERIGPKGRQIKKPTADWRRWPEPYREAFRAAAKRKLAEMPKGSKIVRWASRCDMRVDLSGFPYQLAGEIIIRIPS